MDPDDSLMNDHNADESLWDSPVKPSNDSGETPRAFVKHTDSAKPTYQEQQEREQNLGGNWKACGRSMKPSKE